MQSSGNLPDAQLVRVPAFFLNTCRKGYQSLGVSGSYQNSMGTVGEAPADGQRDAAVREAQWRPNTGTQRARARPGPAVSSPGGWQQQSRAAKN
jgi:hypothetical protein